MWGIGVGFHALGFFTWDSMLEKEIGKIKKKHPDYEAKKLKIEATSKLSNLWLLIAHITYFAVVLILVYMWAVPTFNIDINKGLIDGTIAWGILLGIHMFAYYLFFYNETIKPVTKLMKFNFIRDIKRRIFNSFFINLYPMGTRASVKTSNKMHPSNDFFFHLILIFFLIRVKPILTKFTQNLTTRLIPSSSSRSYIIASSNNQP